jgi:hypothetical protein
MIRLPFLSAPIFIALTAGALSQDQSGPKAVSPLTKSQHVFMCWHCFHGFVYRMVGEMAKSAGIKDHQADSRCQPLSFVCGLTFSSTAV